MPLFASEKFKDRSKRGLYTDVIEEIDDSVGQIISALKENGLENNTIIIFTSDNGPWLSYGGHAGKTGIYREGKGTTWEGGQRVPCIVWYPKEIENKSIIDTPLMGIDWMPTIARLTKSELSSNKIDGKDIWDVLTSKVIESPMRHSFSIMQEINYNQLDIKIGKCIFHTSTERSMEGKVEMMGFRLNTGSRN